MEDADAAGFFTVLCGGPTDISAQKQLNVVYHFVKNKAVYKVFVKFEEPLRKKLLEALSSYGIHLEEIRGQGYDKCASMKGYEFRQLPRSFSEQFDFITNSPQN